MNAWVKPTLMNVIIWITKFKTLSVAFMFENFYRKAENCVWFVFFWKFCSLHHKFFKPDYQFYVSIWYFEDNI